MKQMILLSLMIGLVFLGGTAGAVPILKLSDGISTVNIFDNGAGDSESDAGTVGYSGGIGAFTTTISVGLTKPTIGNQFFPMMHLNSVEVSGGTGTLSLWFTDTDFVALPDKESKFSTEIGGVTDGQVTINSYYDSGNAEFGTSGLLASFGSIDQGPFSASDVGGAILSDPFSMTLFAEIEHFAGQIGVTSLDAEINPVPTPEPATMILFGTGLISLAGLSRRTFKKKSSD